MIGDYNVFYHENNEIKVIIQTMMDMIRDDTHLLKFSVGSYVFNYEETEAYKLAINKGRGKLISLLRGNTGDLSDENIRQLKEIAAVDVFEQMKDKFFNLFSHSKKNSGEELGELVAKLESSRRNEL